MQDLAFKCWAKAQIAKQQVKEGVKNFFSEEKGGADTLVIAIILIVVVVAVAIIFREQIYNWVTELFNMANEDLNNANLGENVEVENGFGAQ